MYAALPAVVGRLVTSFFKRRIRLFSHDGLVGITEDGILVKDSAMKARSVTASVSLNKTTRLLTTLSIFILTAACEESLVAAFVHVEQIMDKARGC